MPSAALLPPPSYPGGGRRQLRSPVYETERREPLLFLRCPVHEVDSSVPLRRLRLRRFPVQTDVPHRSSLCSAASRDMAIVKEVILLTAEKDTLLVAAQ